MTIFRIKTFFKPISQDLVLCLIRGGMCNVLWEFDQMFRFR